MANETTLSPVLMEETILKEIDLIAEELNTTRSAYLHTLARIAIQRHNIKQLVEEQIEGYKQIPSTIDEFMIDDEDRVWGDE